MMQFIMFGSLDALIFFAAWLNREGSLTVGQFASFQFYMFSFLLNFIMIANVVGEVMGLFGTMASIAEVYLYEPKILLDGGDDVPEEAIEMGNICVEDIKFTYPTK